MLRFAHSMQTVLSTSRRPDSHAPLQLLQPRHLTSCACHAPVQCEYTCLLHKSNRLSWVCSPQTLHCFADRSTPTTAAACDSPDINHHVISSHLVSALTFANPLSGHAQCGTSSMGSALPPLLPFMGSSAMATGKGASGHTLST